MDIVDIEKGREISDDREFQNESEASDDVNSLKINANRLIRHILLFNETLHAAADKEGYSPVINGVRYKFPLDLNPYDCSGDEFVINPDLDKLYVLSDEYALISTYCFNDPCCEDGFNTKAKPQSRRYWLLKLFQSVPGVGVVNVNEDAVLDRITLLRVKDFIRRTRDETQMGYRERLAIFNNGLDSLLRAILDIKGRYPVDFADLSIREIVMFGLAYGTYLSGQGKTQIIDTFRDVDEDLIPYVIAAFQICEFNPNDAAILLNFLQTKHGDLVRDVLKYYRELCQNIELDDLDLNNDLSSIDKAKVTIRSSYYVKSKRVAAKMITEALHVDGATCFTEFLEETRKYLAEEIYAGAILTEFLDIAFRQGYTVKQIEDLIKINLTNISVVRGGGKVRDKGEGAMGTAKNYTTDDFTVNDYNMICRAIDDSLTDVDSVWRDYLKANISSDVENPDVYWVIYRTLDFSKNPAKEVDVKTIAAIKIKHIKSGPHSSFYLGTMYVHGPQQLYGIGDHLQRDIISVIKDKFESECDPIYWGSVAAANPFMQRHIEKGEGIVTRIIREGTPGHMSNDLYQVEWGHSISKFQTKSMSKKQIREICTDGSFEYVSETAGWAVGIFLTDTTADNLDSALALIKAKLKQGYVITRYFYDFKNEKPDLSKTYIVFEKSDAFPIKPAYSGYVDDNTD